jgi:hypothetical protein
MNQIKDLLLEATVEYLGLDFGHARVGTPYFINSLGMLFARQLKVSIGDEAFQKYLADYRANKFCLFPYGGKGTPTQIVEATKKINVELETDISKMSPSSIDSFMRMNGIGVDCSGFAYNIINHAIETLSKGSDQYENHLQGLERRGVYRAGVRILSNHDNANPIMDWNSLEPGDLIVSTDRLDNYHVRVVLDFNSELGLLSYADSNIGRNPDGVKITITHIPENMNPTEFFKRESKNLTSCTLHRPNAWNAYK